MKLGIIGALPEELEELEAALQLASAAQLGGNRLLQGELAGHQVVLARSGVGKVNAAVLTLLLIQQGVDKLVFTGVAGALEPSLRVGDVVVSRDLVQHDVDVTAFGYAPGQLPGAPQAWEADPELRELALEVASEVLGNAGSRVALGRVASGDQFIADAARVQWLRETFGASCVEMEGAAVAQVCSKWRLPFVVLRSISDSADQGASGDFASFSRQAARRAKRVVFGVLERLAETS